MVRIKQIILSHYISCSEHEIRTQRFRCPLTCMSWSLAVQPVCCCFSGCSFCHFRFLRCLLPAGSGSYDRACPTPNCLSPFQALHTYRRRQSSGRCRGSYWGWGKTPKSAWGSVKGDSLVCSLFVCNLLSQSCSCCRRFPRSWIRFPPKELGLE